MNSASCKDLLAAGRQIQVPVSISLSVVDEADEFQSALVLEQLIRILPGKRLVALTEWQGKPAIAKLFFQPRSWQRHLQRELEGLNLLAGAGLNIPVQFAKAKTEDGHGAVLISQYLGQARSLDQLSQQADTDGQYLETVGVVLQAIGDCHKKGIWQQDIHPDNFLLEQGNVFCIDGASVKKHDKSGALPESVCLENIITFFAQFPIDKDRFLLELFTNYQRSRADTTIHISWPELQERVTAARKTRLDNYEKKLFRPTTENQCLLSFSQFVVYKRSIGSPEMNRFIRDPDSFISGGKIIKAGNSSTVAKIVVGGNPYIVKRYNIKNPWHGIKRLLRPSRAHNSWRQSALLQMLGIDTAEPFLCLEQRWLWLMRGRAYFLCEDLSGNTVADQLAGSHTELLIPILNAYQNLFDSMLRYNISHGDMKATNFIYREGTLFVLDLDAMQRHKSKNRFAERFRKDLMRFRKNWIDKPAIDKIVNEHVTNTLETLNKL